MTEIEEKCRKWFGQEILQYERTITSLGISAKYADNLVKSLAAFVTEQVMAERQRCLAVITGINLAPDERDIKNLSTMKSPFEGFGYGQIFIIEQSVKLLGLPQEEK
jgi:hypothetical protein